MCDGSHSSSSDMIANSAGKGRKCTCQRDCSIAANHSNCSTNMVLFCILLFNEAMRELFHEVDNKSQLLNISVQHSYKSKNLQSLSELIISARDTPYAFLVDIFPFPSAFGDFAKSIAAKLLNWYPVHLSMEIQLTCCSPIAELNNNNSCHSCVIASEQI